MSFLLKLSFFDTFKGELSPYQHLILNIPDCSQGKKELLGKKNFEKKFFENEFTITVENTIMGFDNDMHLVTAKNDIVIEIGGETINAVDELVFEQNASRIRSITAYKR